MALFYCGENGDTSGVFQCRHVVAAPAVAARLPATAGVEGLGAAIMSAWLVSEDVAAGRLVHLMPAWRASSLPVYLVYPQARCYPARLRLFLQAMRDAMPDMVGMLAQR